jgi:hypothetical protein
MAVTAFVVAALTFAIVANVPSFRQSAISAPIASFIFTPSLISAAIRHESSYS